MDYDKTDIARVYDTTRDLAADQMRVWLDLAQRDAHPAPDSLIVDLGCGTGRFSEPLAKRFSARVIAIDPSATMLDVARAKVKTNRVEFQQAAAHALPLPNSAVDLVFMSMVIHHFDDPGSVACECRRIMRPGGRICARNVTQESDFPHRHFFPSVEADLPSRQRIKNAFESAGFALAVLETVIQVVEPTWQDYVQRIALRAYSTLARVSDAEFATGLAALKKHAATRSPTEAVTEEVDWFVFA